MNLDWDWPEFPPEAMRNQAVAPVTIEVLLGNTHSFTLSRAQQAQ
jgi:hypothetical protein